MKISNGGVGPKWTRHIKQARDRVKGDTTVIKKKYGECCCQVRSNEKAGIFNTGSGMSNLTVCEKFQLVRCI